MLDLEVGFGVELVVSHLELGGILVAADRQLLLDYVAHLNNLVV